MGATGIEWTQICAAGVVLVVPVAIFFYLIRKHLLMGMTFGVLGKAAGLGHAPPSAPLARRANMSDRTLLRPLRAADAQPIC